MITVWDRRRVAWWAYYYNIEYRDGKWWLYEYGPGRGECIEDLSRGDPWKWDSRVAYAAYGPPLEREEKSQ